MKNIQIILFALLATCEPSSKIYASRVYRSPSSHLELSDNDSNKVKINTLLKLLSGTRLTMLNCDGGIGFPCQAALDFLANSGFKKSILISGEKINNDYLSYCEVVQVTPKLAFSEMERGSPFKVTLTEISFKFCSDTVITFTSAGRRPVNINYATTSQAIEKVSKEFSAICPINKPGFDKANLLKLRKNEIKWKEDSLIKYLRNRPKTSIEGAYEEIIADPNAKIANLSIGIVKNGQSYDILYLSGHKNIHDWEAGELKGRLEATGASGVFKVLWYDHKKEPKRNLYANYQNGNLRISLPANVRINYTDGSAISDINGLFIKVLDTNISKLEATATGFLLPGSGVIITNHHVVEGAEKVYIRGIDGDFNTRVMATVSSFDRNNDLAVLKPITSLEVDTPFFNVLLKPLDAGSNIFVLGYPANDIMGNELKVTGGIVSSRTGFEGDISVYQISAAIQPGNSGSPVFDENGNLVGVVNAGLRYQFENVSYAVKSTYLNNFLTEAEINVTPPAVNKLKGLSTADKVKALRKYVYIIEVEK